jgi:predicted DCC family thiol-disulfide oxidoreductase YuxK
MATGDEHPTLLFDGHCGLCNGAVDWVMRHDPAARIRFAALQSAAGMRLRAAHHIAPDVDAVILIADGEALVASDAVLRVARLLGAPWSVLAWFGWVPRTWRDAVYGGVAQYRDRLAPRRATCRVPTAAERPRFLLDA